MFQNVSEESIYLYNNLGWLSVSWLVALTANFSPNFIKPVFNLLSSSLEAALV